jgi:hypothetical protein
MKKERKKARKWHYTKVFLSTIHHTSKPRNSQSRVALVDSRVRYRVNRITFATLFLRAYDFSDAPASRGGASSIITIATRRFNWRCAFGAYGGSISENEAVSYPANSFLCA